MWLFSYLKACIRSLLSASKHQTFGSGRNGPHVLLGLPHNSTVATLNPDPKILQGPGHLTSWKLCHSCILRSCKIAKANGRALRGLSCLDFMGTEMGDPFLVANEEQTRNRLHQRPALANLGLQTRFEQPWREQLQTFTSQHCGSKILKSRNLKL